MFGAPPELGTRGGVARDTGEVNAHRSEGPWAKASQGSAALLEPCAASGHSRTSGRRCGPGQETEVIAAPACRRRAQHPKPAAAARPACRRLQGAAGEGARGVGRLHRRPRRPGRAERYYRGFPTRCRLLLAHRPERASGLAALLPAGEVPETNVILKPAGPGARARDRPARADLTRPPGEVRRGPDPARQAGRGAPRGLPARRLRRHPRPAERRRAGRREAADRADAELARRAAGTLGRRIVYKRDLLDRLRAAHDSEELARMERAVQITRAGHEAAARATVAGVSERDVQTQIEFAFFSHGATGLSYSSIVGSGENGAA